jgi:acetyl esterase
VSSELDPAYAAAAAQIKQAGIETADPLTMPLAEARALQDRYFAFLAQDLPPVASIRNVFVPGPAGPFALRLVYPADSHANARLPVVVFVRGAGWWAGALDSHERSMRIIANASGCVVCGVDYTRAPEAHFPVQRDQVCATVRWLRTEGHAFGIDAQRLALTGESAGANLSALVAARLNAEAAGTVKGLALFYGNYNIPGPETRAYSKWVWANYLGVALEQAPVVVIPMRADVSAFPPAWLGVGECDPLMNDSVQFAEKLRAANVLCELKRYPGVPHAFVMLSRLYDGATSALRDAAAALRGFLNK